MSCPNSWIEILQEEEIFELRVQTNAALHDEDNNKFAATSIHTKLQIVGRVFAKIPSGHKDPYKEVLQTLLSNLGRVEVHAVSRYGRVGGLSICHFCLAGAGRKATISKWTRCHKSLPSEIRQWLSQPEGLEIACPAYYFQTLICATNVAS